MTAVRVRVSHASKTSGSCPPSTVKRSYISGLASAQSVSVMSSAATPGRRPRGGTRRATSARVRRRSCVSATQSAAISGSVAAACRCMRQYGAVRSTTAPSVPRRARRAGLWRRGRRRPSDQRPPRSRVPRGRWRATLPGAAEAPPAPRWVVGRTPSRPRTHRRAGPGVREFLGPQPARTRVLRGLPSDQFAAEVAVHASGAQVVDLLRQGRARGTGPVLRPLSAR